MTDSTEVLERARRLARAQDTGSALHDLREGLAPSRVAVRRGLPEARVRGVASFYDQLAHRAAATTRIECSGTACWAARKADKAPGDHLEVSCLGRCYEAPVEHYGPLDARLHAIPTRSLVEDPVVFRHIFMGRPPLPSLYRLPDPDLILDRVESSGLRGRGGAAYPTAAKWRAARRAVGVRKYVVANGDEGDPGSFVDRLLMEEEPHSILAGMNACAHAIGATHGVVFVRGEYPLAVERVRAAIAEAEKAGVLVSGLRLEVHVGAGSYVCGEETALLRAIEGLRAEASPKPPYPAEQGLHGMPTVVQNVETLSVIPWILETGLRPTTKAFSLSGAIASPGAVEASFGITLRELLHQGGGGPLPGRPWTMALVGGPMGTVLPESAFDARLDPATMPGLGHGGIVVFDAHISPRALAEHLFAFAASESCGACTPCRIGSKALASTRSEGALHRLLETLELGSLCGFGQSLPRPLRDLMQLFPGELFPEGGKP
jgi:NADH:ubiquinone oxidoreductase subunit F (NADH-binding)